MKKCSECGKKMEEKEDATSEGIAYKYFKCSSCGEEIVDMQQLHDVAEKYRALKRYYAKVTKWGQSLGLRIPKELVVKYRFKPNDEVILIPDKKGIIILPPEK